MGIWTNVPPDWTRYNIAWNQLIFTVCPIWKSPHVKSVATCLLFTSFYWVANKVIRRKHRCENAETKQKMASVPWEEQILLRRPYYDGQTKWNILFDSYTYRCNIRIIFWIWVSIIFLLINLWLIWFLKYTKFRFQNVYIS